MTKILAAMAALVAAVAVAQSTVPSGRPRASDLGLKVGIVPTGPLDAISDVAGVEVGHTTIIRGDDVRTGVTAILPHSGNLFREKVPGAIFVGNGFGKLVGSTQVNELGEIETPILLTSTLSVPRVADALIDYMLALPGNEGVESVNPLVGETNDGYLNDIRGRHIRREKAALQVGRLCYCCLCLGSRNPSAGFRPPSLLKVWRFHPRPLSPFPPSP
jgi:D-aminopeptidase